MKSQWILIANASRARLLQQEANGRLTPLDVFVHPASRQRSSALADDKAGRELGGRSFGGAAFEPHIAAQRKEHLAFARELGDMLERGAQEVRCESVTLFASSPFLGELKQALGPGGQRLLAGAHDVDMTAVGLAELQQRIRHELSQAP
jgi:protein required for attachment to host cells